MGGPGVLDRAEYWKQGWMYWEFKDFGKNWGSSQKEKNVKRLHEILTSNDPSPDNPYVRTYLTHVAGEL